MMKLGIIVICLNNEKNMDVILCVKYLNKLKDIEICLVNNSSKDNTYELLKEIRDRCKNVSIVDIKKIKSDSSAVKAGMRFMSSQFNLKYVGFVHSKSTAGYESFSLLLKEIVHSQTEISNYNHSILSSKGSKLTMFQSLFPVVDFLDRMQIKNRFQDLDFESNK